MNRIPHWLGRALTAVVATAVVVLAMAWLSGTFHTAKIQPAKLSATRPAPTGRVIPVAQVQRPRIAEVIGSIQAENRTAIASRIMANIIDVKVRAGDTVQRGDVLVVLDDRDLVARVAQAQETLRAAQARRDLAKTEVDRLTRMVAQSVASQQELERWRAEYLGANADVARAQQAVAEAEVALSHAKITSPISGVVIDRLAEPGDQAAPGRTLLIVYDPSRLQLEASVREAYLGKLHVGQQLNVYIDALRDQRPGTVREIVPAADPASRSFLVKVHINEPAGLIVGMFGRLRLPLGESPRIEIPHSAVRSVGQLTMVDVHTPAGVQRRSVRLGARDGDNIEVLAGLAPGEMIVVEK